MTRSEKLTIAQGICAPLLRKIRADLQRNIEDEQEEPEEEDCVVNRLNPRYSSGVSSPGRHVRTRSVVASGGTNITKRPQKTLLDRCSIQLMLHDIRLRL